MPIEKKPNLFFPIYIKNHEFSIDSKDGFVEVFPITNTQKCLGDGVRIHSAMKNLM